MRSVVQHHAVSFFVLSSLLLSHPVAAQEDAPAEPASEPFEAEDLDDFEVEGDDVVLVTPGRRAETQADSVAATQVLTREQIIENGSQNVSDALRDMPGIEVTEALQGTTVRVQGLDPQHTLILIDGEPVIGRVGGAVDLSRIQVQDVERIEVVRGASSALYGSAAHGGVINIITRRGGEPFSFDARVNAALVDPYEPADGNYDLGVGAGFRVGELTGRADFGFHQLGAFDNDPSDIATNGSASREYAGGLSLGYRIGRVRLGGRVRNVRRDMEGIDLGAGGAIFDRINRVDELMTRATLAAELNRGTVALQLYYTRYRDQFVYDQRLGVQEDRDETTMQRLGEISSQYSFETDSLAHVLTVGFDAQLEGLSGERISGASDRKRVSPYAQHEWTISEAPRVSLVSGARLDVDSQFGVFGSPKLAMRVDPVEQLVIRASVGRGFRAPNFRELYLDFENPSAGYRVRGNDDLDPETSWSLQVEARWTPVDEFSVRAAAYHNRINDLITTDTVDQGMMGMGTLFSYFNVSKAVTQGGELTLDAQPHRFFDAQLGYVLLYAEDRSAGRALVGRPRHRATFRLRFRHADAGFTAVVRGAVVGRRPQYVTDVDDNTTRIWDGRYLSLDLRLEQNVGDHFSVVAGASNLAGAGTTFVNLRPRTFFVGARARY